MPPSACGKPTDSFYTVKKSDVGKKTVCAFGKRWDITEHGWGSTLKLDVGKRVFNQGDFLAIENGDQRDRRLGRARPVMYRSRR